MAKPTIKLCKMPASFSPTMKHPGIKKFAAAPAPGSDFVITVGPSGANGTVWGTDGTMNGPPDANGNPTPTLIDISAVATLTAVSVNSQNVTVSVTGQNFTETGLIAPTTGNPINFTETWNDGSIGPFNAVDTVDTANPVPPITGIVVVHQAPAIK